MIKFRFVLKIQNFNFNFEINNIILKNDLVLFSYEKQTSTLKSITYRNVENDFALF